MANMMADRLGGPTAPEPSQRLLAATIAGIERDGLAGLTVRRICADAGVNIAAVSYYFGGKDRLLEVALSQTLDELHPKGSAELAEAIAAAGGNIPSGMREFLRHFLPQMVAWPRLTAAHYSPALDHQDYDAPSVQRIRHFLEAVTTIVAPAMPHPDHAARRTAVAMAWAMLFQAALVPKIFLIGGGDAAELDRWASAACLLMFGDTSASARGRDS